MRSCLLIWPHHLVGVNVWSGKVVHPGVAESVKETPTPLAAVLS